MKRGEEEGGDSRSGARAAVAARALLNDGSGPALYLGMNVKPMGSATVLRTARFDGQWHAVGELPIAATDFAVFDDGSGAGPAIYAAGAPEPSFYRWDGTNWHELPAPRGLIVHEFAVWEDDSGSSLWAGGQVYSLEDYPIGAVAHFRGEGGCPAPCYANCDGSTVEPMLTVDDFTCFVDQFAVAIQLPHEEQVTHYANCDGSTEPPVLTVSDFTCFVDAFAKGCP